ncbi:MAG TPA: hypothetical protein VFZ00_08035, partial [Solirubrobacter sp.]|nr:hypothetical protein [Solirubrobacter sp.]
MRAHETAIASLRRALHGGAHRAAGDRGRAGGVEPARGLGGERDGGRLEQAADALQRARGE